MSSLPPPPPQQPVYGAPVAGGPPPNYLVWAIISILICLPLGIPAIIFSTQVNSKWQVGDVAGAHDASKKAKTFSLWATIAGGVFWVLWIIWFVFIAAAATSVVYYY